MSKDIRRSVLVGNMSIATNVLEHDASGPSSRRVSGEIKFHVAAEPRLLTWWQLLPKHQKTNAYIPLCKCAIHTQSPNTLFHPSPIKTSTERTERRDPGVVVVIYTKTTVPIIHCEKNSPHLRRVEPVAVGKLVGCGLIEWTAVWQGGHSYLRPSVSNTS